MKNRGSGGKEYEKQKENRKEGKAWKEGMEEKDETKGGKKRIEKN